MRVIKIDPHKTSVEHYELPDKDSRVDNKDIYKALDCRLMQFTQLMPHIVLIIDEEGLLKYNHHWCFDNLQNFAGPALLCGYEPQEGILLEIPNDMVSIEAIMSHIVWLGDDRGLERSIQRGLVRRPQTTVIVAGEEPKIIWEWKPNDRPHN